MKVIFGLLSLFLLTGCWSSVELNDRDFVKMMVLDKAKSGIELSLDISLPNRLIPGMAGGSGEQAGKPYTYINETGVDISEAYRKMQSDLSRKISFGQTRVIVIGRELAEEGIQPILDFIAREPTMHINAYLFVTPGRAKEIQSVAAIFERFPSDIAMAYAETHVTLDTTVKDFLAANYSGGDLVVPMLRFGTKRIESEKQKEQKWMGTSGAAIFKQGKMVNTLNTSEMRGGLWILGKLKNAEISIPSPTDRKNISFIVQRANTRINPRIKEDQIEMQIQSNAEAEVLSSSSNINLLDLKQLEKLEQSLSMEVKKRITSAIAKSRAANSDAFQLGNYIDWHYPVKWKSIKPHWRDLYSSNMKLEVQAHITIKRLGTYKQSVRAATGSETEAEL
ncbi:Ger(x)C family spore germination protein [Paenibacillus sp. WQ 127069]|uniref:Ger(X)C family spore germination protein n=1 Tax=Paenibacillus baimaensis TaxID=2982185 RepID=A0ABT2UPN5_9BACL|nr:Ger(x)C family spore germination protein [Paenibacillus sp. WQ 127069]MCU6796618.1 Ger(x)C family spore germination protein [Paenibacillus sp. WQ 127069]